MHDKCLHVIGFIDSVLILLLWLQTYHLQVARQRRGLRRCIIAVRCSVMNIKVWYITNTGLIMISKVGIFLFHIIIIRWQLVESKNLAHFAEVPLLGSYWLHLYKTSIILAYILWQVNHVIQRPFYNKSTLDYRTAIIIDYYFHIFKFSL